jgi:predicted permease
VRDDEAGQREIERELGDRYQIVRTLGRGAFGAVYLARERQLHRLVAIKALHADRSARADERARLLREARTVANLSHPAIVPLLAFGETASAVYMVMPYVGGETLADRLQREERLDPREVRRILIEVADALAYAHGEGVLHRDLKPENVLLERAGAVGDDVPPRVRLIDFGVAAFPMRDPGVSATYETWGTPQFMAPEQAFGEPELDPRSELYSLGVLGFLLLGGQLPFAATSPTERLIEQRRGVGDRLRVAAPDAPDDLVAAIDRCLAYEPEARWRRARDLRDALVRGADAAGTGALTSLSLVRQRLRAPRRASRALPAPGSPRRWSLADALDGIGGDVRVALRGLARTPGFTAAVVLTLALGVSATTVVFSAVEALLLRPLPVADPGSLVVLDERQERSNSTDLGASVFRYDRFRTYQDATGELFSGLAGQQYKVFSVRAGGAARAVTGLVTSRNYFDVLGVRPALGRFYAGPETAAGSEEAVAVVGHDYWRRVLGGDPRAVGRTLFLDSRPLTIVAVAPPGFTGAFAGVFAFDVWVPAATYQQPAPTAIAAPGDSAPRPSYARFNAFARLRPGVELERANAALRVIAQRVPADNPTRRTLDAHARPLTPLPGEIQEGTERFMAMLLAVAGLVLLIAATNAAGMLLARATGRAREVATRLAVGGTRGRLVRQLFVESVLLCAAAGLLGVALTWWPTRLLNGWQPPLPIPLAVRFELNRTVLAVAAATVLGTALVAGLLPALQATRMDLASAMKEGGLQAGVRRTRLRGAFVVAQVALSVVLLAVAGLFVRSLQRTAAVDPGLRATGVAYVRLSLAPHGYDEARARVLFARLDAGLRARPEIAAAAFAANAPLSGSTSTSDATRPDRPGGDTADVQWSVADVGLVELLGVPLLAGRTFTAADRADTPPVVVVNETLARRLWPDVGLREVLGRQITRDGVDRTVVGVIGNGKYTQLQEDARSFGYVPFAQDFRINPMLYLRARGTTDAALAALREELAALDPNVALERPTRLTADIGRYLVPQRVGALLVGAFGVVALVLVLTGVYGVLAYGVAQRLREFGVRVALGARTVDVVRLVVRNGLVLVGTGVVLGLAGALVAGRLIASFLFGLSPADPLTLAAVPLLLVVVTLAASAVPARRAAAADPMTSLRAE